MKNMIYYLIVEVNLMEYFREDGTKAIVEGDRVKYGEGIMRKNIVKNLEKFKM